MPCFDNGKTPLSSIQNWLCSYELAQRTPGSGRGGGVTFFASSFLGCNANTHESKSRTGFY